MDFDVEFEESDFTMDCEVEGIIFQMDDPDQVAMFASIVEEWVDYAG